MSASGKRGRGSPTASEAPKGKPGAVVIGGLFSLAFLGASLALQDRGSSILKLPPQWLAAAVVPVLHRPPARIGPITVSRNTSAATFLSCAYIQTIGYARPGLRYFYIH